MAYSQVKAERQRLRKQLEENALARAYRLNRSHKCGGNGNAFWVPRHAGDPEGCKNDGTGCLCECHD
jgi:hypothetical protein